MLKLLEIFWANKPFIPHGHCYLWQSGLVGLHILSDSLIALAYYSIPITLLYFVRKRQDLPFNWIFLLFGSFIVACGTTHVMEIWTLWHPTYWLSGAIKAITALISVYTALLLIPLVPKALALPSPAQLEASNRELMHQIGERQRIELALQTVNVELGIRVEERTTELSNINQQLRREIAERERVENALRESEERLQAILNNSPALVYVKDIQGRYVLVNHQYELLFNWKREEIEGKTDYELFPQQIADSLRLNDQRVMEAKSPLESEEVVPQDDSLHIYLSVKFPLYDATGVPYAVCGISTDITERKRAEAALQASLKDLADIKFALDQSSIVAITDPKGTITYVNDKFCEISKYSHEELLGQTHWIVNSGFHAPDFFQQMWATISSGQVWHGEIKNRAKDGTFYWVDTTIVPFLEANRKPYQYVAIRSDITERKRAEAEIRNALDKEKELGELKSRFVTMASHEFRTPLATILSSTELLEHYSHKWSEEKKLNHLHRIQAAVKHMTGLLNDVLLIGKAEAGKLEFKPTPLDLGRFCHDLVEEVGLTASTHKIVFHTQSQPITTCMDEKLLRHILSNLLSNAIKYSPQAGNVHFDLVCEQGEAIFRIQDQGIGIPEADQTKLFNPFHRACNVGNISGTGLGLAIVKKSVDLHGGKIAVASEIGVGTTFTVILPLNKQM